MERPGLKIDSWWCHRRRRTVSSVAAFLAGSTVRLLPAGDFTEVTEVLASSGAAADGSNSCRRRLPRGRRSGVFGIARSDAAASRWLPPAVHDLPRASADCCATLARLVHGGGGARLVQRRGMAYNTLSSMVGKHVVQVHSPMAANTPAAGCSLGDAGSMAAEGWKCLCRETDFGLKLEHSIESGDLVNYMIINASERLTNLLLTDGLKGMCKPRSAYNPFERPDGARARVRCTCPSTSCSPPRNLPHTFLSRMLAAQPAL